MPSRAAHHAKAATNVAFFKTIDAATHGDWAVVVLFYAALHLADACMDPWFHPADHGERNRHFTRVPALRNVYTHYRQIQDDSRAARYEPPTTFDGAAVAKLVADHYVPIYGAALATLPAQPDCTAT